MMYIAVNGKTDEVLGHNPILWTSVNELIAAIPCMETADGLPDKDITIYKCTAIYTLEYFKTAK